MVWYGMDVTSVSLHCRLVGQWSCVTPVELATSPDREIGDKSATVE